MMPAGQNLCFSAAHHTQQAVPFAWHDLRCLATCLQDARDFGSDGYSLRVQHKFSRHIKLLICVTLYNEDQDTLGKTLLGICEVGCCCCRQAWCMHVCQP